MHHFLVDFALRMLALFGFFAALVRWVVSLIHEEQTQGCEVVLEFDLVRVEHAEVVHVAEDLVAESHTVLGVVHGLGVLLRLAQDGTQLEFELALHVHLFHPLRNVNVFEEVGLVEHLDGLLQVNDALLKHAELLEAHRHVVIGNVREVLVPLTVLQIDHLENTLSFLQKHVSLFVLVLFDEFIRDVRKF